MDKLKRLYNYIKKDKRKKILFLTTSNRWEGEKELVKMLEKQLAEAQQQWDEKGPDAAAYCYGYLIGTIRETIYQLEN